MSKITETDAFRRLKAFMKDVDGVHRQIIKGLQDQVEYLLEKCIGYSITASTVRKILNEHGTERLNREIRRRTNMVEAFPDAAQAITLVTGQLKYAVEEKWRKKYMIVSGRS